MTCDPSSRIIRINDLRSVACSHFSAALYCRSGIHLSLPETADVLQQGLPAIALDGHCALSTAAQNDIHPLLAPAEQIVGYGRPGDVFIGISTSGNSRNVALAAAVAKGLGLVTIGLTGASGGTLSNYCDCTITVPASTPADVQELRLPVYHTLCAMLESELFEE